jgi:hypothetical protein
MVACLNRHAEQAAARHSVSQFRQSAPAVRTVTSLHSAHLCATNVGAGFLFSVRRTGGSAQLAHILPTPPGMTASHIAQIPERLRGDGETWRVLAPLAVERGETVC